MKVAPPELYLQGKITIFPGLMRMIPPWSSAGRFEEVEGKSPASRSVEDGLQEVCGQSHRRCEHTLHRSLHSSPSPTDPVLPRDEQEPPHRLPWGSASP